jgi:hypothetical protein
VSEGRLTIVGMGIKLITQSTIETRAAIQGSQKVYFLSPDLVSARWIAELNPSAESLNTFLKPGGVRLTAYAAMVDRILTSLQEGMDVCAVFYGHPGVLVYPAREALRRARGQGFEVKMLPAISAEDCLFADLAIDPGEGGCQSFEASDFLISRRPPDVTCHLVLWQIGVIGQPLHRGEDTSETFSREALHMLVDHLITHYGPTHQVTLYEAPLYVMCSPRISYLPLAKLTETSISQYVTLFIPRLRRRERDPEVLRKLRDL